MSDSPSRLSLSNGETIAYHVSPGKSPGIVFLGGLMSDMTGTKALYLEARCRAAGRAFLRFDYSGHGASDGAFVDGTIGRWHADALAVLDRCTSGPQVLVGSSMGGWQMLLAARARPERVAALVGVAAAPDFTEDLIWAKLDAGQRRVLREAGVLHQPSDYDDGSYPITWRLVEEGRAHLLLRRPIAFSGQVHLLHGMRDPDVPWRTALRIADHLESASVAVELIKDGDHRLSREADLARLWAAVGTAVRSGGGD